MEDFGYQFEKIILRATDLGLGTRWIGGIFNRSRFADKAGIREDEVLAAISPLGYPTPKRSVADSIIRWSAGSRNRRPWAELFFHGTFATALTQGAAGGTLIPRDGRLGPPPQPAGSKRQEEVTSSTTAPLEGTTSRSRPWTCSASTGDRHYHLELTAGSCAQRFMWKSRLVSPLPERTEYVQSWITP
jgi:hypothetical protein